MQLLQAYNWHLSFGWGTKESDPILTKIYASIPQSRVAYALITLVSQQLPS